MTRLTLHPWGNEIASHQFYLEAWRGFGFTFETLRSLAEEKTLSIPLNAIKQHLIMRKAFISSKTRRKNFKAKVQKSYTFDLNSLGYWLDTLSLELLVSKNNFFIFFFFSLLITIETLVAACLAMFTTRNESGWSARCSASTCFGDGSRGNHKWIRNCHTADVQVISCRCCVCQFALTLISITRMVFASPKSIQATVTLLENLHIILEKTPQSDIRSEVLPLLFNSFESNTMQIQSAALVAVANVYEYVDELSIRRMVLPKIKTVFEKNQSDLKIMSNVLQCVERILDKLDKSQIIDEVLPMLYEIRLSDPEIILRVVRKYIFLF